MINATGAFSDLVRRIDDPKAPPMISPSQGVHLVLDRSFLPGDTAIMVPRTSDGRVMFAIPWHEHALLGTTDLPIDEVSLEPVPMDQEIDFILETAAHYLARPPKREDIRSAFAGIRPLVKAAEGTSTGGAIARSHDPRGEERPAHHRRRQVDHLPQDGRGLRRSRGHAGQARRAAVRDQDAEHPRLPPAPRAVRRPGLLRRRRRWRSAS